MKVINSLPNLSNVSLSLLNSLGGWNGTLYSDNILAHPDITNIVLYNDEDDYYEWKMNLLPGIGSNFRESSNPYYRSCLNLVQIRKIMVDVDAKVFLQNLTSESTIINLMLYNDEF